ncbi:hypothetical protein [Micromonospora rubida]|uniref:hypothetical protein n=1 Tax=Micromonospora rubida TaxID=2697657 RepID=UPI001377575B|nr:hypothetical protein [Micromonospora rubida]NBE81260.1 hypothetical protein [Micromonospora rubida]
MTYGDQLGALVTLDPGLTSLMVRHLSGRSRPDRMPTAPAGADLAGDTSHDGWAHKEDWRAWLTWAMRRLCCTTISKQLAK